MPETPYIFDVCANDALPLEYKLHNGYPTRQANLSDFINNPSFFRVKRTDEGYSILLRTTGY
jgi:hypothetical protein